MTKGSPKEEAKKNISAQYLESNEEISLRESSKENLKSESLRRNESANTTIIGEGKRKSQRKIYSFGGDSRGSPQSKIREVISPKSRVAPSEGRNKYGNEQNIFQNSMV